MYSGRVAAKMWLCGLICDFDGQSVLFPCKAWDPGGPGDKFGIEFSRELDRNGV